MTQGEMAEVMAKVFAECQALRGAGQREYAHDEDNAFRNFEGTGKYVGLEREKVLLIFMLKHIDGITAYIRGHKSQREDVRGRINDAIVYLCLLRGMIEEREGQIGIEAVGVIPCGATQEPTSRGLVSGGLRAEGGTSYSFR